MRFLPSSGLALVDLGYRAKTVVPAHVHDETYLCLTTEGTVTERWDSRRRDVVPGHFAAYPAGETHSLSVGSRTARIFHVGVPSHLPWHDLFHRRLRREGPGTGNERTHYRGAIVRQLSHALRGEVERGVDDVSELRLESLVFELLAEWVDLSGPLVTRPSWMRDVLALVRDACSQRVTLTLLAHQAGVHPAHLVRAFRRYTGMTPGDYVRRLRVVHAVELLRRTRRPIAEIALTVGFADQSHLGRCVRRYTGMTPAAVRREGSR